MTVRTSSLVVLGLLLIAVVGHVPPALGEEPATDATKASSVERPHWIWSAPYLRDRVPVGTVYFRRVFEVSDPKRAELTISADDRYEVFVNGKSAGQGNDARTFETINILPLLTKGRNCIAVRAQNVQGRTAGLAARAVIQQEDGKLLFIATGPSWKAINREFLNWTAVDFNEASWGVPQLFAPVALQSREEVADEAPADDTPTDQTTVAAPTAPPANPVATPPTETAPAAAAGETTPPATAAVSDAPNAESNAPQARFVIKRDFRIERIIKPEITGSAVSMAFNEFGDILLGQEQGPILLVQDKDKDGKPESTITYCEAITSCQGLLPVNGDVFAVGKGPEGAGLYRLHDDDHDHTADTVKLILPFEKEMGEHGPHGVTLGPDGWLYVVIGNHAQAKGADTANSPYSPVRYEGDLVQPKYEDGGGHAVGIKAPGGTVVRCSLDGSKVETVAGGLRNAYDLAFSERGDLFTFDSDMEWDTELPWYRPTRVLHVTPGAEFGWRSGWSKWPDYYLDSLPAVLDTGRGSPTGIEVYEHHRYPPDYQGAIFLADWTMGQILTLKLTPSGGTYATEMEVFIQGRPLNVTDLAVGPDGWLYFVTGGRDSEGGVYRVVYTGRVPSQPRLNTIGQAVRQPQFNSAWGRQHVAKIHEQMGDEWGRQLATIANAPRNRPQDRARAIELLQLYGPVPTVADVLRWSSDPQPLVRAKATAMLGLVPSGEEVSARLAALLGDPDPHVRRRACEAIVRGRHPVDCQPLLTMLSEEDRFTTLAARRALQIQPSSRWADAVLNSENNRVFLEGSVALLTLQPETVAGTSDSKVAGKLSLEITPAVALVETPSEDEAANGLPSWLREGDPSPILNRCQHLMQGFLSDQDFIDLLRVVQLALSRDVFDKTERQSLASCLANEYPTKEPRINRELVRLLAYFDEPTALPRMLAELRGDAPQVEKVHLAFHLRFMTAGWTSEDRLAVLDYLEQIRNFAEAGHSVSGYIDNVTRDFVVQFAPSDRAAVLAAADKWPTAALTALAGLPEKIAPEQVDQLIKLDAAIAGTDTKPARRLRTGIVAVLARNGDDQSMEFLRNSFEREPDRRGELAMGLAQQPEKHWNLLVQALPVLEGGAAQEVLRQMAACQGEPDNAETVRQVILCGLRLGDNGGQLACQLLTKWSGDHPAPAEATPVQALAAWQVWFAQQFPDAPAATPPSDVAESKYSFDELLTYLDGDENHGRPERGGSIFEKASCAKCHSFAGHGETIGPDLSTVARRFQRKEILQSLLFPSQVISDQYASKTVTTVKGLTYTGIVGASGVDGIAILQANGEKVVLKKDDIEDITLSPKSSMPEGLLNSLTLDEIADLFAYLQSPPELARAIHVPTSEDDSDATPTPAERSKPIETSAPVEAPTPTNAQLPIEAPALTVPPVLEGPRLTP